MEPVGSRGVDDALLAGLTITVRAAAVVWLWGLALTGTGLTADGKRIEDRLGPRACAGPPVADRCGVKSALADDPLAN